MNDLILTQNESLTMSSREIAELTGKQHSHVFRDARKMIDTLEDEHQEYVHIWTHPQNKQSYEEYILPKDLTITLVSGYNIKMRHAITKRWIELESKQTPALPGPKQLALMVINAEEEKEAALLEVDRIQGICQTITAQFKVGMTPAKFCKQLNGVNVQKVNKTLVELNKLYSDGKGYSPTSVARDDLFKANYGDFAPYPSLLKKGAKWLYRAYLGGKLPMKNTWDGVFVHVVFEE